MRDKIFASESNLTRRGGGLCAQMLGQWDERARGGAWQLRRLLVCNGGLAATIRKGGPDRTLRSARQLYDDKGVAASRRPRHTPKLSTEKEMPRFPARNRIPVPFEDCEARRIRSPNLRRRHLGSTRPQTLTASSSVRVRAARAKNRPRRLEQFSRVFEPNLWETRVTGGRLARGRPP